MGKASTSASASAHASVPPILSDPLLGSDGAGGVLAQPPAPGPGCTNSLESHSALETMRANFATEASVSGSIAAEVGGSALFGAVEAGASTSASFAAAAAAAGNIGTSNQENESKNQFTCAPDFDSTQVTHNTSHSSTDVDMSVTYMTKDSLKSLSENTNQMVVNSITNTTSNTSQSVDITQSMVIRISGCAKDLLIENVKQTATIDLTQMATMTMKAIDDVRTDLAQAVLQQFQASTTAQNNQILANDIMTDIAAAQSASVNQKAAADIVQNKESILPGADPVTVIPENLSANVHLSQTTTNDAYSSLKISAPFLSKVDIDKQLISIVNNSVTQNFTKNTVNILAQTVIANQNMVIEASNIGGNCTVRNIEQNFNITLRQTLTSNLNIGTSVISSISNTLGIKTDDSVTAANMQDLTTKIGNTLRSDQTSSQVADSNEKYTQSIKNGTGVVAICVTYCILCTICCLCIFGGLGGLTAKAMSNSSASSSEDSSEDSSEKSPPEDSSEKSPPEDSSEKLPPEDSSSDEPKGGFSFFN
jgi:hypothetical protein